MKKAYVFVDPCNSGRKLVDTFKQLLEHEPDAVFINIESIPYDNLPLLAAPERAKYTDTLYCNRNDQDSIDQVLVALKRDYQVQIVMAAQEPGVLVADYLSEHLALKTTNRTAKSTARFDKAAMMHAIAEAGVDHAPFIESANLTTIKDTIKTWPVNTAGFDAGFPVFIKVLRSACTDGVYRCDNAAELDKAFEICMGHTTAIGGDKSVSILAQSFLDGPEYVVNTVSMIDPDDDTQVIRYVSDVWQYQKKTCARLGQYL